MHVPADKDKWRRLADYVIRRRAQLVMTQEDVRAAGGPSTATMRLIEGALQTSYRPVILARLEAALRWEAGSVQRILEGGEPIEARPSQSPPAETERRRRALDSLAEDIKQILDASELPEDDRYKIAEMLVEEIDRDQQEAQRRWRRRAQDTIELWRRARSA